MPDPTPTPGNQAVVIRHSTLTYVSLGFNGLILLLILIAIVCGNHHKRDRERGDWGGGRFEHREFGGGRGFERFHHHFGPMRDGWDRHGSDGAQCPMCNGQGGPNNGSNRGFDGRQQPGWGNNDRPNFDGNRPNFGQNNGGSFGGPNDFKPMTLPNADDMTTHFMAMMTQRLSLTNQESTQIKPIVQGAIAQFQKDMEAQKAAHQKMIEDAKTKVRAVLTPDQQKEFDAMTAMLGGPSAAPAPASK